MKQKRSPPFKEGRRDSYFCSVLEVGRRHEGLVGELKKCSDKACGSGRDVGPRPHPCSGSHVHKKRKRENYTDRNAKDRSSVGCMVWDECIALYISYMNISLILSDSAMYMYV